MATEFALERSDKSAIGTLADVEVMIREHFPDVAFGWTKSGQEKLRIASQRQIELPAAIRQSLEGLPSLREGRAKAGEALVEFGLGYREQVRCIYVTPHGDDAAVLAGLSGLAKSVGGKYVVSGEETNRIT